MLFVSQKDLHTVKDAYEKDESSYDKTAFVLKDSSKKMRQRLKVEDVFKRYR